MDYLNLQAVLLLELLEKALVKLSLSQSKLFAPMVLVLIFTEALALYGLIVGMIMAQARATYY